MQIALNSKRKSWNVFFPEIFMQWVFTEFLDSLRKKKRNQMSLLSEN